MSLSIVPEIRELQKVAGPWFCAHCVKPLKRKPGSGRQRYLCWDPECRNWENAARKRWRTTKRRQALDALARVIAGLGWSTQQLERMVKP